MLTHQNIFTLWLLLLLHVSASAMKFSMFKKKPYPQKEDVKVSEGHHDGKWGTVCDDGWDMTEAQVVCRQLHFPADESAIGKIYGKGTNGTVGDSTHTLDHSNSLSDDLGQIFDSGNGCDFLILVQSPTGNRKEDETLEMAGTTVCAHKLILSQFPRFNASEGITGITVNLSQACQPHFTSFIRYIYTRKLDVTFSSVQCLHWMAYTFGVKQLMEDTGRLFINILPEDASFYTQLSLYQYAVKTGDLVLNENCIQYLAWNYQNLTKSPVWTHLPVELLGSLLVRSDLVVPDEYFLLQTVEKWIMDHSNSTSLETQADLLSRIRFPMIPAEALYDLKSNSSLYSAHRNLYRDNILKAFQFNFLLLSKLMSDPKFDRDDDDYRPRIYTATPWSAAVSAQLTPGRGRHQSSYGYGYQVLTRSLTTPFHNSLIFKNNQMNWQAAVLRTQPECSNYGVRCKSLPVARLITYDSRPKNIVFRNRLLLMCQGKYICQVQDFKDNLAFFAENGTQVVTYPCPDDKYTYRFVVRPEYS